MRSLRTAAIQLLAERSYEGMNLRLLASKLRMHAGSLYNYIESKQQLLFWLMKDSTEKLLREFEETIAKIPDPREQMLRFVAFHTSFHIANRKEASVLLTEMRSLTPQNYRAIKQLQRAYTDEVQKIVERGMAAGVFHVHDSRIATFVLLQMLTSVARWYTPKGRLTVDELVAVYTDLAFSMLGAETSADRSKDAQDLTGRIPAINGFGHGDPITHSVDLGSHLLHISVAPHPGPDKRGANGTSKAKKADSAPEIVVEPEPDLS
ncbi:MAG TPA: TetR/AcrR family transcriptional regulator [Candidatus Binataceae bacterium]|nr:TetR/AcrR family transcriptional regulator [Candidatus Binataceae bacterium]